MDHIRASKAPTLGNTYLAMEHDLALVPVINKIDLPAADPDMVAAEIENVIGLPNEDIIRASAKEGTGVKEILESLVKHIPPPQGNHDAPLRALVFDSHYDAYKGVIAYVRIVDGEISTGDNLLVMSSDVSTEALELGRSHQK